MKYKFNDEIYTKLYIGNQVEDPEIQGNMVFHKSVIVLEREDDSIWVIEEELFNKYFEEV